MPKYKIPFNKLNPNEKFNRINNNSFFIDTKCKYWRNPKYKILTNDKLKLNKVYILKILKHIEDNLSKIELVKLGRLYYYCNESNDIIRLFNTQPSNKVDLKSFENRYGKKSGKELYDLYIKKLSLRPKIKNIKSPLMIPYWIDKGCTIANAKQKISELQSSRAKKRVDFKMKHKLDWCKEYWLAKGYNIKESICLANENSKKCHITLNNMINIYGEEDGIKRWNNILKKRKKTLIKHYGVDNVFGIYGGKASRESLKILIPLYKWLRKIYNIKRKDICIGITGSREFILNGKYFYDFTIKSKKIIIEYNGINWHPKKRIDENFSCPITSIDCAEKYDNDKKKILLAENAGFSVLKIWSDETIDNNISKCKKFIKDNIK